jgi:hypothetical protein
VASDERPLTTPLGEAVEQAADGLAAWSRQVASLVQHDADRIANGEFGLARLASSGLRLLRVNVDNILQMVDVLSDNIALLAEAPLGSSPQRGGNPRSREVRLMVTVPAGVTADFVVTLLRGTTTAQTVPTDAVSVQPSSHDGDGKPSRVTVVIATANVATDIYEGTLRALDGDVVVASVPFQVAIDELN